MIKSLIFFFFTEHDHVIFAVVFGATSFKETVLYTFKEECFTKLDNYVL